MSSGLHKLQGLRGSIWNRLCHDEHHSFSDRPLFHARLTERDPLGIRSQIIQTMWRFVKPNDHNDNLHFRTIFSASIIYRDVFRLHDRLMSLGFLLGRDLRQNRFTRPHSKFVGELLRNIRPRLGQNNLSNVFDCWRLSNPFCISTVFGNNLGSQNDWCRDLDKHSLFRAVCHLVFLLHL